MVSWINVLVIVINFALVALILALLFSVRRWIKVAAEELSRIRESIETSGNRRKPDG